MILSDTDILSALAKVGRRELLFLLFEIEQLYIVPAVFNALKVAQEKQYPFTSRIFDYIEQQRISLLVPTPSESAYAEALPSTFGAGERDSLAVAHQRGQILLCNESRVTHLCRTLGIEYMNVPMLLRAFWLYNLLTQNEVRQLIADLYTHDQLKISATNLAAIFAQTK